jgi:hypothetical protein
MASDFRALSIQQPWASAIAYGPKRVENRTWSAPPWIIGQTIALHASKGPDWDAPEKAWIAAGLVPYRYGDPRKAWTASLVLGAVVALAEVTGCHHSEECMLPASALPACGRTGCSPWAARRQFHITLDRVRPLREPVPCRGALGLWRLPVDIELAVREQLDPKTSTEEGSGDAG